MSISFLNKSTTISVVLLAISLLSGCATDGNSSTQASTPTMTKNNQYSCVESDNKTSPLDVKLVKNKTEYWFSIIEINKGDTPRPSDDFISNYKTQVAQQQLPQTQKDVYQGRVRGHDVELMEMHKSFSLNISGMSSMLGGVTVLSYKCTPKS